MGGPAIASIVGGSATSSASRRHTPVLCSEPQSSRAIFPAARAPPRAPRARRPGTPRASRSALRIARLRAGPDAGQLVEHRGGHRAVAPAAVMGDREAVRLVAHALQQLELRRVVAEEERLGIPRPEHLLDPLGQRDDRDAALAEALQHAQPGRELPWAAVDHDEVRQGRERGVERPGRAARGRPGAPSGRGAAPAPRPSRRSRRGRPPRCRGCGSGGSRSSSARRPRRRPSRRPCGCP